MEAALRRFELPSEIVLLRSRGHAEELARAARADGVDVLAIAAGDAVLNEVVQSYADDADDNSLPRPDLALLAASVAAISGAPSISPGALEEAVARLRHGRRRAIDLGHGHLPRRPAGSARSPAPSSTSRASASKGKPARSATAPVARRCMVPRASPASLAAGRALGAFQGGQRAALAVDGAPFYEGPIAGVALANGRYFAGGLRVAPQADPTDGQPRRGRPRRSAPPRPGRRSRPRLLFGSHLLSDGVRFVSRQSGSTRCRSTPGRRYRSSSTASRSVSSRSRPG